MASGGMSLEQQFVIFSKFGDGGTDGKKITLTNTDIWLRQAKILDERNVTLTDTGVCFNKMRSRTITFPQFLKFLEDIASCKKLDVDEIKTKMMECSLPGADEKKEKPAHTKRGG